MSTWAACCRSFEALGNMIHSSPAPDSSRRRRKTTRASSFIVGLYLSCGGFSSSFSAPHHGLGYIYCGFDCELPLVVLTWTCFCSCFSAPTSTSTCSHAFHGDSSLCCCFSISCGFCLGGHSADASHCSCSCVPVVWGCDSFSSCSCSHDWGSSLCRHLSP